MSRIIKHIPVSGIGLFVLLYIYSASKYPGGSVIDERTVGYDWFHNYWCDLMYANSLNGASNTARPYAVFAWIVLCVSILVILLSILTKVYDKPKLRRILQVCAVLAMSFGVLAATDNHDLFVVLSFPFGAVIVLSLAIAAQQFDNIFLKLVAWLVVSSLTASFIMYFTSLGLYWIGFIQKIALALSFIWVIVFYYQLDEKNYS